MSPAGASGRPRPGARRPRDEVPAIRLNRDSDPPAGHGMPTPEAGVPPDLTSIPTARSSPSSSNRPSGWATARPGSAGLGRPPPPSRSSRPRIPPPGCARSSPFSRTPTGKRKRSCASCWNASVGSGRRRPSERVTGSGSGAGAGTRLSRVGRTVGGIGCALRVSDRPGFVGAARRSRPPRRR